MKKDVFAVPGIVKKGFLAVLMSKSVQRILLPFGHDLKPDRWIFVIGCYNSATTLLASILRKHPDMGGLLNEGAFLTDVLPYPEMYGWPRMWCQCFDKLRINIDAEGKEKARRIKRHWSIWYPEAKKNLVEKSISNTTRLLFLQKYFEPAYFIYIVRNGFVVSKGIQKKANYKRWSSPYQETGYPIELCAQQWKITDEIVERDEPLLRNLLQISYEELTECPKNTFNKITDFLDMHPLPEKILGETWSVHETVSSITNMNHIGLSRLERSDFEKIERIAGDTLRKYGYI